MKYITIEEHDGILSTNYWATKSEAENHRTNQIITLCGQWWPDENFKTPDEREEALLEDGWQMRVEEIPPPSITCPTHGNIKGCGKAVQFLPDDEGFIDCPHCGLFFKADPLPALYDKLSDLVEDPESDNWELRKAASAVLIHLLESKIVPVKKSHEKN